MGLITVILLAIGLSFDSFAVSLSSGMCHSGGFRFSMFRFSAILALFQGIMPFLGWLVAIRFRENIEAIDHWIAFALLCFIGGKMLGESFNGKEENEHSIRGKALSWGNSIVLGFATSIDALVAGLAMALVPLTILPESSQWTNVWIAILIITLVTFVASFIGLFLGCKVKGRMGVRAEFLGGIILILIGLKILMEHLMG